MRYNRMAWDKKYYVLYTELSAFLDEYKLESLLDIDHMSFVYIPSKDGEHIDGWHCEYPKLEEIMDRYDLYSKIELIPRKIEAGHAK